MNQPRSADSFMTGHEAPDASWQDRAGGERVSLRFKFLMIFIPIVSAIVVTALGILVYLNGERQRELLETRAELIARLQASALAKPMWELDTTQIKTLIVALEMDPDFLGAAIVDASTGDIMDSSDGTGVGAYQHGVIEQRSSVIRIEEPIVYYAREKREELGRLVLVLSVQTIRENLKKLVYISGIAFVVLLAAIVGVVFMVLQGMVFRPLSLILDAITDIEKKIWHQVEWESRDELGSLVGSFNHMITSLEVGDRAQSALKESEQRYAVAMSGANDGLWDWDLRTGAMYFSPRWRAMVGLEEKEVYLSEQEWFDRVHPEDRDRLRREIDSHLAGRTEYLDVEHRVLHRDGTYRWMLGRGASVRDDTGKAYRMAGSLTDITERKKAEEQLLYNAFHDTLTGLPNRALMIDRLAMALNRYRRDSAHTIAVLFIDFDRFKMVNDSLGHMAGDRMLIICAQRLQSVLRETDTIARLGGDEFVILLEDLEDEAQAVLTAQRIQDQLSIPLELEGQDVFTSASIGIVFAGARYEKPEDLLRDADIALYEAKATGRGKYVIFDTRMHTQAVKMLQIDSELRRALERNEFAAFYQPLVDLDNGRLIGFEALARWFHPERGMVPPGDFIPVAEETGLIEGIGNYICEAVLEQHAEWVQKYPDYGALNLSINCSPVELSSKKYTQRLDDMLSKYDVRRDMVKIEITESAIMDDPEEVAKILHELKELGVQLWIDDFGTGHSSLGHMHLFPFDGIKVDRSFVSMHHSELKENPWVSKPQIVKTIVSLAQAIDCEVVAEGVETPEQYAQLKQLGVTFAQGFLFSKPVEVDTATRLVDERRIWPNDLQLDEEDIPG